MKRLETILILILTLYFGQTFAQNDSLSANAIPLLKKLNSKLYSLQQKQQKDINYGGVFCTHCNIYHTRAAEAIFPFAFEYKLTRNKEKLDAAIQLGRWLIKQQQPTGEWVETPESWTGTTTDQLLMLLLSYPILSDKLSVQERKIWLESMEKAGDYLTKVMDNVFASLNYCATTTATLSELNLIIPKEKYKAKAKELAHDAIAKMNAEYFPEGEGSLVRGKTKYGVDIGYNMEMTLWGLTRYAQINEDTLVLNAVRNALKNHIWFVYPNGALDGSWAIRSNKWTLYGGGTSDGCQVILGMFAHENDRYRSAAIRNIHLINQCFTPSGLLGYGPHHSLLMEAPPCIYPTFTKAKNLAMAMLWTKSDIGKSAALNTDIVGYRFFPSLNVAVVRTEKVCATVTAYSYVAKEGAKSKYMHRPTGGTTSALWIKNFGFFQVSSQTEYHRWEEMHFPEANNLSPLTPRIEFECDNDYFTNLYEFNAGFQVKENMDGVTTTAYGELRNRNREEGGIGYVLEHSFGNSNFSKKYLIRYESRFEDVKIIEPIVYSPGTKIVKIDNKNVRISTPESELLLTVEGTDFQIITDEALSKAYWSPYPAVQAFPVIVLVKSNGNQRKEIRLNYRIIK